MSKGGSVLTEKSRDKKIPALVILIYTFMKLVPWNVIQLTILPKLVS